MFYYLREQAPETYETSLLSEKRRSNYGQFLNEKNDVKKSHLGPRALDAYEFRIYTEKSGKCSEICSCVFAPNFYVELIPT
jgi:hypothetical protein